MPRKKSLLKKKYKFAKKIRSLAKNIYRFSQEKIERVGKGLVFSWFGLGFRLRGRSVE